MEIISRKDALAQGLKHYFTGKPCKEGHVAVRRTVNCRCQDCERTQNLARHHRAKADPAYRKAAAARANKHYYDNYESCRVKMNAYGRSRLANDSQHRAIQSLRAQMRIAIKRQLAKKTDRTMSLIGCTSDVFFAHLEAQFAEGMSWDNHGEWHIDHIRPCASFDLLDPEQQRQCFHYTNLQPLWAADNLRKSDTWQ